MTSITALTQSNESATFKISGVTTMSNAAMSDKGVWSAANCFKEVWSKNFEQNPDIRNEAKTLMYGCGQMTTAGKGKCDASCNEEDSHRLGTFGLVQWQALWGWLQGLPSTVLPLHW